MNGKTLIALIKAAEHKLSMSQASQEYDIPYKTVVKYAKLYELKFACGRRLTHERLREERLERKRNSSAQAQLQANGSDDLSSKKLKQEQLEAEFRGIEGTTPNNRTALERWKRVMLANAKSDSERREIICGYKIFAYEIDMIGQKQRPPFPAKIRKIDEESLSWAKRESNNRRDKIIQAFNGESRTASEISEHTGFDLRSTSLFMHNMYREGKVDRVPIPNTDKKNKVYLYSEAQ